MKKQIISLLAGLLLATAIFIPVACNTSGDAAPAIVTIKVANDDVIVARAFAAQAAPSGVVSITVTITAEDMDSITETISDSDGTTILVPAGLARNFAAEAYNSGGDLLYRGTNVVDLEEGQLIEVGIDCFTSNRIEDDENDLLSDSSSSDEVAERFSDEAYGVSESDEPVDIAYFEATKGADELTMRIGFFIDDDESTKLIAAFGSIELDVESEVGETSLVDVVREDGEPTGLGIDYRIDIFNYDAAYLVEVETGDREELPVLYMPDYIQVSVDYDLMGISDSDDPEIVAAFGNRGGPTDIVPNEGTFVFGGSSSGDDDDDTE
jgi:hypothetical protein